AILLVLLIVRTSCLEVGIARTHFGWQKEHCDNLKRVSTWLLAWWFPLMVLTAFTFKVEVDSITAVLGRLLFCLDMVILTYILLRFLVSGSLEIKKHPRWRFWAMLITVSNGVFFISYAILGYLYSSQVIFEVVNNSLIIIIAAAFIFYIMQRWLLVYRRRLRFDEMLAARQSLKEGEAPEAESETVDLVSLSESVSSLLKVGTVTFAAFLLVITWAPLFRALEVMQRITLWTVNDMSEGEAILTSITLASLVQALLIGLFTIVAARNVPPLLSLVLRGKKNISQGSRYAIVKLLGYLIITVGILAFLSKLGLRWDRLQWLVAALGVGIGFGLQEIIANFISGLIILFERPVRVGDVVTVGDCSGEVIRIRIRATTIRDFDGKELLVPNKEFVTGRLLNWTLSDTSIRMTFDVGIAYGSDVRKAVKILEDILRNHDLIAKSPAPDVVFSKFDDSALNLTARYFFTDVQQRGFLLSDLHMKINDGFKEAGIVIAFPQIDVHFDRDNKDEIPSGVVTT
ncbi:MAG: mechanosensitive ion channel, partial [Xanthomonadales bacterium]|nr:mechanosensitive ion channel [Xanthomonadales bacterium]